jgi:hypothetical protein
MYVDLAEASSAGPLGIRHRFARDQELNGSVQVLGRGADKFAISSFAQLISRSVRRKHFGPLILGDQLGGYS